MDLFGLENEYVVVMGIANHRSIAWEIAKKLDAVGAKLIFTYRQDRSKEKLESLLEKEMPHQKRIIKCDANNDESIEKAFKEIKEKYTNIKGLVHSIAFANKDELKGEYLNTSREGYILAQESSSYSLVAVVKHAKEIMKEESSIITMTYLGGERVVQNYNVMGVAKASLEASVKYLANDLGKYGIRVNAVSAGPIRTLAAKGIAGFNDIIKEIEEKSPMKKSVSQEDVAKTSLYLLSDLSTGVTGENIHVDSGYHIIGF